MMCNYEVMWFTKCWEHSKQSILEHQLFSPAASTKPIFNKNTRLKAPFRTLFFKCYILISCFLFIEKYHILCIFLHIIKTRVKKNAWLSQFSGILQTAVSVYVFLFHWLQKGINHLYSVLLLKLQNDSQPTIWAVHPFIMLVNRF